MAESYNRAVVIDDDDRSFLCRTGDRMTTRREFLSSMAVAGLASQPVFRESAMRSLFNANAIAGDRSPDAVADDET
jgi:hypothetical protein